MKRFLLVFALIFAGCLAFLWLRATLAPPSEPPAMLDEDLDAGVEEPE